MKARVNTTDFKLNDFLTLKLEEGKTRIYVKGEKFEYYCRPFLVSLPTDKVDMYKEAESLEDVKDIFTDMLRSEDLSLEQYEEEVNNKIDAKTEFWAHCSNLQAWVDNKYDTSIMMSNLAFPILL